MRIKLLPHRAASVSYGDVMVFADRRKDCGESDQNGCGPIQAVRWLLSIVVTSNNSLGMSRMPGRSSQVLRYLLLRTGMCVSKESLQRSWKTQHQQQQWVTASGAIMVALLLAAVRSDWQFVLPSKCAVEWALGGACSRDLLSRRLRQPRLLVS